MRLTGLFMVAAVAALVVLTTPVVAHGPAEHGSDHASAAGVTQQALSKHENLLSGQHPKRYMAVQSGMT